MAAHLHFGPAEQSLASTYLKTRPLALSAFSACIRVISEDFAKMPREVLQWQLDGTSKTRRPGRIEKMLSLTPNQDMTAFSFWQTMVSDMLIWGNCYAEAERDLSGRVIALHPLMPERVQPMRRSGTDQLIYRVSNRERGDVDLLPEQIFHVPGFCRVPGFGMPALAYMAETIGEGIAMRDYSASFFGNDATPGGILSTEATIKDDVWERIKHSWESVHKGARNSHKVAILEAGLKWQAMSGNNDTSQLLESRLFNVVEITRHFRVPVHKINHLEDASYNNIAELSRGYAQDTLAPIVVKFEQECDRKIFGQNRERFFVRINMDELTRGDMQSRYQAYHVARQDGWLNADEIRAKEDMNPIGGVEGTARWWPSNTVPADKGL